VLFVGFQAEGTLGRYIVEGSKRVKMMGMEVVVNADIRKIDGFSAHADYQGLLKWISGFKTNPRVFVVHGEPLASESFKEKLERKGLDAYVPYFGETIEL
jgi:metallo-beta-lactamase family protein